MSVAARASALAARSPVGSVPGLGCCLVGLAILLAFCLGTLTMALSRARRGDPLGWLLFLFMVFYLLLNLTNALTQEYFQPPFVIILISLGLLASGPAPDPARSPSTAESPP